MRLNSGKVYAIMKDRYITKEQVSERTGLYIGGLNWILTHGRGSIEAFYKIADAIGADPEDILLHDLTAGRENRIEYRQGEPQATAVISDIRQKNQLQRLARERPTDCKITAHNRDGSIIARIPADWIIIAPTASEYKREPG